MISTFKINLYGLLRTTYDFHHPIVLHHVCALRLGLYLCKGTGAAWLAKQWQVDQVYKLRAVFRHRLPHSIEIYEATLEFDASKDIFQKLVHSGLYPDFECCFQMLPFYLNCHTTPPLKPVESVAMHPRMTLKEIHYSCLKCYFMTNKFSLDTYNICNAIEFLFIT